MTVYYLDPSAWVKRHFQEEGSEAVNALFRTAPHAACCDLGLVEMVATIARKSQRESLDSSVTETLLNNVKADFAAFHAVSTDKPRIIEAMELALRHHLRTMDALHLTCALSLRPENEVILVSADMELLAAARQEGLTILNPTAPTE